MKYDEISIRAKIDQAMAILEKGEDIDVGVLHWYNMFLAGIVISKQLFFRALDSMREQYLEYGLYREVFTIYKNFYRERKLFFSPRNFAQHVRDINTTYPEALIGCVQMSLKEIRIRVTDEEFSTAMDNIILRYKNRLYDDKILKSIKARRSGDIETAEQELKNYIVEFSHLKNHSEPITLSQTSHMLQEGTSLRYCIPTPFNEIDRLTGGLWKGELVVIEGGTSGGKSALMFNMVYQAVTYGEQVLLVTLEMETEDISAMFCSRLAYDMGYDDLTFFKIRRRKFETDTEKNQFEEVLERMNKFDNFIIQRPEGVFTIRDLEREIDIASSGKRLDMVAVDYFELLDCEQRRGDYRIELKERFRIGKRFTNEKEIVLITPHQVPKTRMPEVRKRKPFPFHIWEDLQEASAVGQSAVVIIWIYVDDSYKKHQRARMGICKNRTGKTNVIGWEIGTDWDHWRLYEDGLELVGKVEVEKKWDQP